ncbi:hypothetical protein R5H30_07750 [Sulfitobacter sp. D35]|uniref:hypothetical protein n=1 Tax=Sulfitobacter sp. D35 TaxID=3083252 RepID=UPI00296FE85F|nr:hypothetical protein [Sulfitobacter sp. D35]MDW4497868.1 hypothetical protein [Sulfitobacter sp. D35]
MSPTRNIAADKAEADMLSAEYTFDGCTGFGLLQRERDLLLGDLRFLHRLRPLLDGLS